MALGGCGAVGLLLEIRPHSRQLETICTLFAMPWAIWQWAKRVPLCIMPTGYDSGSALSGSVCGISQ
ncbi:MAG: hypothetical protein Tsb002_24320 [Wenzhouxiangellaceae bacterium]